MIYYKVLTRVTTFNTTIYYLKTDSFKFKKHIKVIDPLSENWIVYMDFDSLYPVSKFEEFNEGLFRYLNYLEVQDLFILLQNTTYDDHVFEAVLTELANTLMYWDDYN